MTERKFVDLKQLKVSDDGPGYVEGYRSVFNVIDEGGDLIVPGAFKDCLEEYLHSGFTAHSHDWDFDKAVGFPVEAREDDHGWFVRSQFHSTPDAQLVRTKAKERLEAGKQVGFSFGYAPTEYSHIDAKDYEKELAQYVKADQLQETLTKARKFNRIRILKKVDAIEDSLVTAPMNKRAAATAIKSTPSPEAGDETLTPNPEGITESESFGSFESAETAIKKFAQKVRVFHENRTKEGRVLSSSNRAKVQACKDSMTALIADLDDLLTISEPKPKEKEVDVEALRTHSLRMQSLAVRALA